MEPYKIYDFEDEKAWLKGRLNGIGGTGNERRTV